MPTINKRFLLKLILVLVAFTGALVAVHAVQADRIPAALLRQADRAAEGDKTDLAIHYLRQYLEFVPDDVDAQVRLVEQLRKRPATGRGQSELIFLYDRILRLDPERHQIRRDALAACLANRRYSDAVTHAEALLKAFPGDAALWQELGAAQAGLNLLAEARSSYETAVSRAPQEILAYQRLAQLVWKNMNDPAGAREVLDRMVKALPQHPDAHLIRARFEAFTAEDPGSATPGDPKRAMAELQRVLELDPEHAEASHLLAELYQRERKIPAAHALLRDAVSLYPRDLRLVRSLSWLELSRGNTPAAIAVLEDGLKANPDGFELLVPLADLLVQQGDTARTAEILRRLESSRPAPGAPRSPGLTPQARRLQVKYIKARIAMRDAKWAEAVAILEALRGESTHLPNLETQLNLLLAVCAERTMDREGEERAFQRVTNADPKNVQARMGLGNLYLTLGRFDEAVRELEIAAQSPYATGAVIAQWVRAKLARLRVTGGPADEWRRLEAAAVASASRFGPVSSEPVIMQAEIGRAIGKTAEAVQLLRKAAAIRPGDLRLWMTLADATADLSGTAAGLAVIDEAQAAAGDNPDVRLARARLYAAEPGRVRPLPPLAERIESWPESEQLRVLFGMVEVFDDVGDQVSVTRTLRAIAGRRPSDVNVWVNLHERALRTGDAKTAAEARAALVKIEGDAGPSVALCDAAAATPAQAAQVLQRLTAAFGPEPMRADACLAVARVQGIAGNDAEAGRMTERAFAVDPTRYEAARALLVHLCSTGAEDRARRLADRLGTDPRWAGDPFRRLIALVIPKLQVPVAAKVLEWSRPHAERDRGGLGWLADVGGANGVFDPVPVLEAATKRKDATADDWLRLALARNPEDLNGGRGKVPDSAFLAAAAVLAQTKAGKDYAPELPTPADQRLFAQSLLSLKLSRNKPDEATQVLEDYLKLNELPKEDAAWAKRNLAMLYAVGGTPEDRKRAMELIATVDDVGNSPNELRSTASVLTTLSRYLEGGDRVAVLTRAAAALATAYEKGKSPKDLYNLSQLYRSAGNRVESRKCLQQLLETDRNNIYFLTAALEELVEDRNFDAGAAFARKLMELHPGEFRAVAAVARYECHAGRPEAALALADGYARSADPGAGDHLTRSGRVAELLDELARLPNVRGTPAAHAMATAAAERYAALVPSRAEAIVGLVGVLAAVGRADAAFAELDRYAAYLPARVRASAGLAIVRAGPVADKQAAQVLAWLDGCLAEEPNSASLLMNRSEFLMIRNDLAGAAAGYEKVLAAEPRNVLALNNLAWVLCAESQTAERALELVNRATREVGLTGDLLDTRARVRITLKQFAEAERDLNDAIRLEPTALRWFHLAVSRLGQTPPRPEDAAKAFAEAKRRGLEPRGVHPADRATFGLLDAKKSGR
jgi:tetratricopeptide (TPR) repeat protein